MRVRMLLTSALLLAATAAGAAAQTWTYAESAHVEVYTTGGAGRARDTLAAFERVHAFFAQLLGVSADTRVRTRLVVFSGDREFAPYRPARFTSAFYQPGPDRDTIVMGSLDEDSFPAVVHEYVHLLIRHWPGVYPVWLSEGFAEFLSTIEPEGDRMNVGKVPRGRLAWLAENVALMDLEQLFAVRHGSAAYGESRLHTGLFYAQSWALTHMLFTDDRYRPNTEAFLRLVVDDAVASGEAIAQAYGRTLDQVGRDLFNYVRRSHYVYLMAPYEAPPSLRNIPTRTIDAFEADLVTADLLSHVQDRQADARSLYERLSGERPDDLRLLEARAYFELRRGETAAALSYLRRAADAGSRSPFVHREYARLDPGHALAENAGSVTQTPGPQGTPSGGAAAPGSVLRGELGPSGEVVVDPAPVEADGSGERTIQARGRMRAISCRLQTPVIEIATEDRGLLRLTIDDPGAVTVLGRDGSTIELQCGQYDVDVRVRYRPANEAATDTVGSLRVLDYRAGD